METVLYHPSTPDPGVQLSVWDPHLQKDIDSLELVQKVMCPLCILGLQPGVQCHSHSELQWASFAERRAKANVTMIYRVANQLVAIPACQYLRPATTNTQEILHQLLSDQHYEVFLLPGCNQTGISYHQVSPWPRPLRHSADVSMATSCYKQSVTSCT